MTILKYRPEQLTPFNELFSDFLGPVIGQVQGNDDLPRVMPRVNIVEDADGSSLQLLAPGYAKSDLKLHIENDTLIISAEKKNEALNEKERFTRREFTFASFKRSFRLPKNAQVENIKAEHLDGVLTIRIPRTEARLPKSQEITIG